MSVSLSETIATHIATARYEQLSPRVVQMTKFSLLDALGVTLGASGIGEGCDAFVQLALESGAHPQSTVLGHGFRTSPSLAALANGAMAHALDFEDAHDAAPVHPNAQTIPAALALAEALGNCSGSEVITALAVGCDLVCRLGLSLNTDIAEYGWYPPPILGAFGAAATASRLLKLDSRQTLDALSLVLCQSSCSAEIKYSPHSVMRSVRDAFGSQAGLTSAMLAQKGVRGFDAPFEGKAGFFNNFARGHYDVNVLLSELGTRFEGENLSFKPWPACRGTHAYIDCALQMTNLHQLNASDIVSGHMKGHKVQRMLYEPIAHKQQPTTAIDAKFSLPFTVASALCNGEVSLHSYSEDALHDSAVLDLAKRLTFEVCPDESAFGDATCGELTLVTRAGSVHSMYIEHPLGHSSRPMSETALIEKFNQCAELSKQLLSVAKREQLIGQVLCIETQPCVDRRFFDLLGD